MDSETESALTRAPLLNATVTDGIVATIGGPWARAETPLTFTPDELAATVKNAAGTRPPIYDLVKKLGSDVTIDETLAMRWDKIDAANVEPELLNAHVSVDIARTMEMSQVLFLQAVPSFLRVSCDIIDSIEFDDTLVIRAHVPKAVFTGSLGEMLRVHSLLWLALKLLALKTVTLLSETLRPHEKPRRNSMMTSGSSNTSIDTPPEMMIENITTEAGSAQTVDSDTVGDKETGPNDVGDSKTGDALADKGADAEKVVNVGWNEDDAEARDTMRVVVAEEDAENDSARDMEVVAATEVRVCVKEPDVNSTESDDGVVIGVKVWLDEEGGDGVDVWDDDGEGVAVADPEAHASIETWERPLEEHGEGGSTRGVGKAHQNRVAESSVSGGHWADTEICVPTERKGIDRPAAENPRFCCTPKTRLTPRPRELLCAVTRK
jgi:hypothetical protein